MLRLLTATSFALFTLYQIVLSVQIDTNRLGRMFGIGLYLLITVASFLDLSEKYSVWMVHSVLLVTGLLLLFAMRLINLPSMIGSMKPSDPASVLNGIVYILSQIGTLVLAGGYLMLRADLEPKQMRRLEIVLMIVAIVLYVSCYVMECVLLIKYRVNIDLSRKMTLISRTLFYFGYIGTSINFILPAPKRNEKKRPGEFYYSDDDEDEIDLVI